MSGAAIQKKLSKAYGKIGSIMGWDFLIYRSVDYLTPVQSKNLIGGAKVAFALDENFGTSKDYGFHLYNIMTDTTDLQVGDVLVCSELSKTFTLVAKDPLETPQGIASDDTVTIKRATYNNTGGFSAKQVEIASNVPARFLQLGAGSDSGAMQQPSHLKTGVNQWNVWLWLPTDMVKLNDVLVHSDGSTSSVQSVEHTDLGYKIKTVSTKAGA